MNTELKNKKIIFIMSMHRSGTSMLTNILQQMGAYLGENHSVIGRGPGNVYGLFENNQIIEINNTLLQRFHSTWSSLEHLPMEIQDRNYAPDLIGRARKIIEDLASTSLKIIVIKDPRTVLFYDFWMELIKEYDYSLIAMFRTPQAVAASLLKRNNIALPEGLALWQQYNNYLLQLAPHPFLMVRYEDILQKPLQEMGRVASFLDIHDYRKNCNKIYANINKDLCHYKKPAADPLPEEITQTYKELLTIYKRNRKYYPASNLDFTPDYQEVSNLKDEQIRQLDKMVNSLGDALKNKVSERDKLKDKLQQTEKANRQLKNQLAKIHMESPNTFGRIKKLLSAIMNKSK